MPGHIIDLEKLPPQFPTHRHDAEVWEWLGRTIATFGFLEEVLVKAIFAFSVTETFSTEEEALRALEKWGEKIEQHVVATLSSRIETYKSVVRWPPDQSSEDHRDFLNRLTKLPSLRNPLCHGSWRPPNDQGKSEIFFLRYEDKENARLHGRARQLETFDTWVDVPWLKNVQAHTAELACIVISTVTQVGLQFPGSNSPGRPVWSKP